MTVIRSAAFSRRRSRESQPSEKACSASHHLLWSASTPVAGGDLRIIDVSDPAHPTEAGFYDTPGYAEGVAVSGNYVYVANEDGGLVILRFSPYHHIYLPLVLRNH